MQINKILLGVGFGNNRLLSDSRLVSTEIVNIPWRMVSLGGFPGLVPSKKENHDIVIEIYEVDDSTYQRVEYLEGYPSFYQKASIPSTEGDVEIYVLEAPRYAKNETVENGDWVKFNEIEYENAN